MQCLQRHEQQQPFAVIRIPITWLCAVFESVRILPARSALENELCTFDENAQLLKVRDLDIGTIRDER